LLPSAPAPVTAPGSKSVAVLPWRNLGPPDDEYVAEALTEDLIDGLSMTRGLRVRARGAVLRYRGVERDAREIGGELEVEVVVEGSVRRHGDRLRISARSIGVADGFQLWAQRFDRPASDALVVIDELTTALSSALTVERTASARDAHLDPEALDLYLRARHLTLARNAGNLKEAQRLFLAALERAPDNSMLLAHYARSSVTAFFFGGSAETARSAAGRALALGPDRPEPWLATASVRLHFGDPAGAVAAAKRAIALSPSLVEAQELLGYLALEVGLVDKAVRHFELALALDPSLAIARVGMARVHAFDGRWEQAEAGLQSGESPVSWASRVRMAAWRRDQKRIQELADAAPPGSGLDWFAMALAEVARTHRLDGPSMAALDADLTRFKGDASVRDRPLRRYAFGNQVKAELLCYLDQPAAALIPLADATDAGLIDLDWLDRCPILEAMRTEPGFAELRTRVVENARPVLAAFAG
jgi:serine/threonine-protein kinase